MDYLYSAVFFLDGVFLEVTLEINRQGIIRVDCISLSLIDSYLAKRKLRQILRCRPGSIGPGFVLGSYTMISRLGGKDCAGL
jgi:hypothetical protein